MDYGLDTKSTRLKTFNTIFIITWLLIACCLLNPTANTPELVSWPDSQRRGFKLNVIQSPLLCIRLTS